MLEGGVEPEILPFGDCALLVDFGNRIDRDISARVMALKDRVESENIPGLTEAVPSFRSLLLRFDPLALSFELLKDTVTVMLGDDVSQAPSGRFWRVPVCYEGDYAPDIADVAETCRLNVQDVIERHSGTDYHVYMIGFLAGFPYLGDLPDELSLPRLSNPRVRVPRGSVAIALTMVAIYPVVSPGGWRLIGRTPVEFFDPLLEQPALFHAGDTIRFEPVSSKTYEAIERAVVEDGFQLMPDERAISWPS